MRKTLLATLFVVVGLTLATGQALAQGTTGAINGRIQDPEGLPTPGATVTVTSVQGSRTFVTDSQGRFAAPFLTPGVYIVRAELPGFKVLEQGNVEVRVGQSVNLVLTLELGAVTEVVSIVTGAPIIDTRSTTIGGNLEIETFSRVPVGRRVSETLYTLPGVSTGGSVGAANPSVGGGTGLENQYVVDGVNITNQGYGALGSYSIIFGSLGNALPFDFIKEIQVKTAGYEAEFGQSVGGVVNVVTKSGSNNLTGTAFAYARPDKVEADWTQIQTENGTVNTTATQLNDAGVEAGGPVMRNRLFFFGAVDPQWERRTFIAPKGFPLESLGKINRERRLLTYAAKGTWQLSGDHRVDASFFGDPAHGLVGPQRTSALLRTTTSSFSTLDQYGGHNQAVKYDGIVSRNWLVEASFARALNQIVEVPSVDEWNVRDRTVVPNIRTGGIGLYEQGNRSENFQYQAKATNTVGDHQVRYGVLYEDVSYDQVNQRTGPTFTLRDGRKTATGASVEILPDPVYGKIYRVVRANLNVARHTTQQYLSFFGQDTWRVNSRLTILPGIRYEQEKMVGTLKDWTLNNNWAPRIGGTYDPTGGGKTKLYGHYGRFYARIPNDLAARTLSADAGIGADYFDANLTQPIADGVLAAGTTAHFSIAGAGADEIDPNAKLTYINEYLAGFEYQTIRSLVLGVRYIHRGYGRVVEDISPFPIVAADLGLPGADSVDYTLTNIDENTPTEGGLGAKFEKPIHNYDAVELTADKRFGNNWALQASYRWSRLFGTFEGFYRDDNGQSDPGITSLYDFPTNDPSYTQIGVPQFGYRGDVRFLGALGKGPLPLDRPHQVKILGNYTFDRGVPGLNLGWGLTFSSGKPLTPFAAHPNPSYQNGGEIPECPRGCGIQTVDGFKKRTPFFNEVNVHVDYAIKLAANQRLVLLADVFNLFDTKTVLDYDNWTETTFGVENPDYGTATSQNVAGPQIQIPRQLRLGVRFQF